jgi:hypothetical protein
MARKRPCRICRKWFAPHPRAGDRQRACGAVSCQNERHRRACEAWRRRQPDYDREDRLRRRLVRQRETNCPGGLLADPLHELDWSAARDAVGLQVAVTIEEAARVVHQWARDAVRRQVVGAQADGR